MSLITTDDFIDVYQKFMQRGGKFILSKFNTSKQSRTLSAFSDTSFTSSNWWIIPEVKRRWNEKITGEKTLEYEDYVVEKHLKGRSQLKMLSLGSGVCSHELKFAGYPCFDEIICVDIAANLLEKAREVASKNKLNNIDFLAESIYKLDFEKEKFDIILFHSSLHHFSNVDELLSKQIKTWLKKDGMLMINEYVGPNRLQFGKEQIKAVNEGLKLIPKPYRKRFKSNLYKKSFAGSGLLRMILADPSECVESAQIIPSIRVHFDTVEEKPYGGNLLMHILKDISHNFVDTTDEKAQEVLQSLFDLEDIYLMKNKSDFVFGIYTPKGELPISAAKL